MKPLTPNQTIAKALVKTPFPVLFFLALGLGFAMVLLTFIGVLEDVVTSDQIVKIDFAIATHLVSLRTPFLTSLFFFITQLGGTLCMIVMVCVAIVTYAILSKKRYAFGLLVTAAGVTYSVGLLKFLVARSRPAATLAVYAEKLFSFPSGHSASSLAVYGFIAYAGVKATKSFPVRVCIIVGASIVILAIGFSRLYLGVHYLSDVIGGYLLGGLWLIIGICVVELRAMWKSS